MAVSHANPRLIRGENETRSSSITRICADLPPVIYFISTDDGLIKIGYTTDLFARKQWFGKGWERLLAITAGSLEDEAALHQKFIEHRAKRREYYHPHPDILSHINELRTAMHVDPITPTT